MDLPEKLRITQAKWSETSGAHKVQLGNSEQTIAYVWVPGGFSDQGAKDKAEAIAVRICAGWNA